MGQPGERRRARWLAVLASVSGHGLLLLFLLLPDTRVIAPAPLDVEPATTPIELITLALPTVAPAPDPPVDPTVDPAPPSVDLPTLPEARPPIRRPRPIRPTPSPAPPLDPPTPSPPTSGGVALLGLRDTIQAPGRGSGGPVFAPRLGEGTPDGVEVGPSPSAPPSPRPQPRTRMRRDGPPRSLIEAGFRKRKDGSFVMRRAELPFVVRIDAEGRMSFRDQQLKVTNPMVEKIRTAVRNAKDPANAPPVDANSLVQNLTETIFALTPTVTVKLPRLDDLIRKGSGREINTHLKLIFLEGTAELRHRMARTNAEERLRARLETLREELQTLWYDSGTPASARRQALFELWDECDEAPPYQDGHDDNDDDQELERLRQTIAAKARKTIITFVRRHVGQDSEDGYSDEELSRLNARRRSRERFAPYRKNPAPSPPPPP